jgi:hypothetical protein
MTESPNTVRAYKFCDGKPGPDECAARELADKLADRGPDAPGLP